MGTIPRAQPSPPRNRSTPHTSALHTASPAQVRRGKWVRRGRARAVLKSPPRRWDTLAQSWPLAAAPAPLRGGGLGCLGPFALPSFPAVGELPVVLTRTRPSAPASETPSSRLVGGVLPLGLRLSARRERSLARPASAAVGGSSSPGLW